MKEFNVLDIAYVELFVANIQQACHFYTSVFGFKHIATRSFNENIENGCSVLLKQNHINLILTSAVTSNCNIAIHVSKHGDGVKDIAIITDNTQLLFEESLKCGAKAIMSPTIIKHKNNERKEAKILVFGDTCHTFIELLEGSKLWFPEFVFNYNSSKEDTTDLKCIDHFAICLEENNLMKWHDFYIQAFGFNKVYGEKVYTGVTGMNSLVVQNQNGNVKFTLLEPLPGNKKSQIRDFLDFNNGDGVQHIAFLCSNICRTVKTLRKNGQEFLTIPAIYYEKLPERLKNVKLNCELLQELQILIDRDEDGILKQIFTKTIQTQPTFFLEIIERDGATSFGSGNIRALFEAKELEQMEYA